MKHIDEKIYKNNTLDFYFRGMKTGVLDIETTGLNPSKNKFILGGLYSFPDKTLSQFFAENRDDERVTLENFAEEISKLDMVITYNGKHFDMPFIKKRLSMYTAQTKPLPYNLDLYLVINGHSPMKKFVPNLRQKTVENYMGLWQNRTDEISGGESVELYNEYEKTGNPDIEKKILLHNSDDVLQLTRLLKVVNKSDFHKAMFHLGFPVGPLTVTKIVMHKNTMTVTGLQRASSINYMGYFFKDYPVETRFNAADSTFMFKLPIIRNSGMAIADLDAAYLERKEFNMYPDCSSGFLVLEKHSSMNYMETNHFIKSFFKVFLDSIDL